MKALNGAANIIDLSVSERAIRDAKREFVSILSERVLLRMVDTTSEPDLLIARAWKMAELQYDEMIRRRAIPDQPVSLSERMAADNYAASVRA